MFLFSHVWLAMVYLNEICTMKFSFDLGGFMVHVYISIYGFWPIGKIIPQVALGDVTAGFQCYHPVINKLLSPAVLLCLTIW